MTYLPGLPVVPCAVCGAQIDRRGRDGQGHVKYCSPECRRTGRREAERVRKGQTPRRDDGICPRCNVNPRPPRPGGGLRPWCHKCESAQKTEYFRTPAGKATYRRWYVTHRAAEPMNCWWCDAVIPPKARSRSNRNFCSDMCRLASNRHPCKLQVEFYASH